MSKSLKSYKNDLAPIGFFFDIFATDLFRVPIMPIPMRIDKILSGHSSLLILPNIEKLNILSEKLNLIINYKSFFSIGLQNLIKFARKRHESLSYRTLKEEKLFNWFEKSNRISRKIPTLVDDFTVIISEFLKTYSIIKSKELKHETENYKTELIKYCDIIIDYFKVKIEGNIFQIEENGIPIKKQIYTIKKEKYYPNIIPLKVVDLALNKIIKRSFVPYLIYDDILDCFAYNRKLLIEKTQSPCDNKLWEENNIIMELNNNEKRVLKGFTFLDINFETIK
jgi:hypothetical protein